VVVRALLQQKSPLPMGEGDTTQAAQPAGNSHPEQRIADREEVERLLAELGESEALIVRMYHLEGKSYQEISAATGVPENTVGPTLSRARSRCAAPSTSPPREAACGLAVFSYLRNIAGASYVVTDGGTPGPTGQFGRHRSTGGEPG